MLRNWCLNYLIKKNMCFVIKLATLFKVRENTSRIRIQSITMANHILNVTHKREEKQKKMLTKVEKRCIN